MLYRWKTKVAVEETIVVIINVLDRNPGLPDWLIDTINGSIADSDRKMVTYFFKEVRKHTLAAMKYFESRQ
jgi:hypothetical protein